MIYSLEDYTPYVHPTAYVHPQATVVGDVWIGADAYIGPGARLRGDWGRVYVADGCNVQENCTLHMFPGKEVRLEAGAHIGHGAVIHGARVGENCLVGMNAVLMDDVLLGAGCIVGALAFLRAGSEWEERSLIVGNPARVLRRVSDEMLGWKTAGTALYQQLPQELRTGMREAEPLREPPVNRPSRGGAYVTWREGKG